MKNTELLPWKPPYIVILFPGTLVIARSETDFLSFLLRFLGRKCLSKIFTWYIADLNVVGEAKNECRMAAYAGVKSTSDSSYVAALLAISHFERTDTFGE